MSKDPISDDWLANFFEGCQDVGEKEMQKLWAKILAGEVERPGRFSRRTLHVLRTMDRDDAQLLTRFCAVAFETGEGPNKAYAFAQINLMWSTIPNFYLLATHLTSIGLLTESYKERVSELSGRIFRYFGKSYGTKTTLPFKNAAGFEQADYYIDARAFSSVGSQLAAICSPVEIEGFVKSVENELSKYGVSFIPL